MDRTQIIQSLTIADAGLIPQAVRDHFANARVSEMRASMGLPANADLVAEFTALREQAGAQADAAQTAEVRDAVLAEMRGTLNLSADADPVAAFTTLRDRLAAIESEALGAHIVAKVAEMVKPEAVRAVIAEMVRARNPQNAAEADTALNTILESDAVKTLLQGVVVAEMGGAGKVAPDNSNGEQEPRYSNIPTLTEE